MERLYCWYESKQPVASDESTEERESRLNMASRLDFNKAMGERGGVTGAREQWKLEGASATGNRIVSIARLQEAWLAVGRQGPGAWGGDLKICDKCLWIRTEGAERLTWTLMCWLESQLYVNWRAIWPFHQRQGEWLLLADVNQIHGFLRNADAVFSIATLISKLVYQTSHLIWREPHCYFQRLGFLLIREGLYQ